MTLKNQQRLSLTKTPCSEEYPYWSKEIEIQNTLNVIGSSLMVRSFQGGLLLEKYPKPPSHLHISHPRTSA